MSIKTILLIVVAVVFLLVGQEWFAVRRDRARQAEEARRVERNRFDADMANLNKAIKQLEAETDRTQEHNRLARKCLDTAKQQPVIDRPEFTRKCIARGERP